MSRVSDKKSSGLHRATVRDVNWRGESDRAGNPLPKNYVKVDMPWLRSKNNPDPVSSWIPVYQNQMQVEGDLSWGTLRVDQDVLVAEVDASEGIDETGLAVIAYGAISTDDYYGDDQRETAIYHKYGGKGIDLIVNEPSDPESKNNDDFGRKILDYEGFGVETLLGSQSDPTRRKLIIHLPGGNTVTANHPTDGSEKTYTLDFSGTTVKVDALRRTYKVDINGATIDLDGLTKSANIKTGTQSIGRDGLGMMSTLKGPFPAMSVPKWPILQPWLIAVHTILSAVCLRFAATMPGISAPLPPPPPLPPLIENSEQ